MLLVSQLNEERKSQAVASTPQIDVFSPRAAKCFSVMCQMRVTITLIRCHAIWKRKTQRKRGRCDRHGVSIWKWWSSILYFQPTLYLMEELWDKEGFQAAVVWAFYRLHPAPPAGVEMPLHLIITPSGFDSAGNSLSERMERIFVAYVQLEVHHSLRITEMFLVWPCYNEVDSLCFYVCVHTQ